MAGQKASSPSFSRAATLLRRGITKLSRISDWRIASKIAGRVNNRYVFASHETSRGMSAFRLRFDDRENRPGWTKRRDIRKKRIVEKPFFGYGIINLCIRNRRVSFFFFFFLKDLSILRGYNSEPKKSFLRNNYIITMKHNYNIRIIVRYINWLMKTITKDINCLYK